MDETQNLASEKSILLVDDDQFITVAYKDGLERAGYNVTIAHNGEEALDILKINKPDILLLDLIMPKMNGFELLQALKDDNDLKEIPVLVLTNLSQESDEEEARSYGIVDFMVKADISLKDLINRLHEVLGTQ
jgi:two-component system alkaline phosphatase synthesis response regulator PhoP